MMRCQVFSTSSTCATASDLQPTSQATTTDLWANRRTGNPPRPRVPVADATHGAAPPLLVDRPPEDPLWLAAVKRSGRAPRHLPEARLAAALANLGRARPALAASAAARKRRLVGRCQLPAAHADARARVVVALLPAATPPGVPEEVVTVGEDGRQAHPLLVPLAPLVRAARVGAPRRAVDHASVPARVEKGVFVVGPRGEAPLERHKAQTKDAACE